MANRPWVGEDLVIVASDKALVAKEVNLLVLGAGGVLLSLDVLQAVGLVPAGGEDIERDLTTNRETASHRC